MALHFFVFRLLLTNCGFNGIACCLSVELVVIFGFTCGFVLVCLDFGLGRLCWLQCLFDCVLCVVVLFGSEFVDICLLFVFTVVG